MRLSSGPVSDLALQAAPRTEGRRRGPAAAWWPKTRVLKVLNGARLECGCFVGVYETYAGDAVSLIDEPHASCREIGHWRNARVPLEDACGTRPSTPRART